MNDASSGSLDGSDATTAGHTQRVAIETATHLIQGTVKLPPEGGYRARFSDYLNRRDTEYVGLIDAERSRLDGGLSERHPFLAVAKRSILFGFPLDDA